MCCVQVQIGHHSFTFDEIFGSSATPLPAIFDKCVKPLVEGLFHGYNATVLAYGQVNTNQTLSNLFFENSSSGVSQFSLYCSSVSWFLVSL